MHNALRLSGTFNWHTRAGIGTDQRWMKVQSMRMRTRACTKAYTTNRLYITLVLYRKLSKASMPVKLACRRYLSGPPA